MKYLQIWPFGISLVAIIKSRHFEVWKGQNISNSELRISTFPAFQTIFGGWCLGCTAEKGMTWPWHDHLKTYFTELIQLKYKLILSINTMGCCGLTCVVWLKSCEFSKRKSVLIVGNSHMPVTEFLNLTYLSRAFVNTCSLVHKHVKISVDEWILETTCPQKHVKFLEQYIP